jgi:hypothetical protein
MLDADHPEYDRQHPSRRYAELIKLNQQLHEQGHLGLGIPPERMFPGTSLRRHIETIRGLIIETRAHTILDYGAGKGYQYRSPQKLPTGNMIDSVVEYWGINSLLCYDPAHGPFSVLPDGRFDGVISTDVLEHCPQEDLDWIIGEMFEHSKGFVFINVCCAPAVKAHLNGENLHATIEDEKWWREKIDRISDKFPDIRTEYSFSGTGKLARLIRTLNFFAYKAAARIRSKSSSWKPQNV